MRIRNILVMIILVLLASALPSMAVVNEVDSNFDGKIDQWQFVDAQGKVEKIEHDGDFDGKVDQVEHFKGEKILEHVEFDRNKDGKMDLLQYYENGGKLSRVEKSSKFNYCAGEFDFKNNHLLMRRKSYKYWHISKYKRIFSRETYRVEFSLGKSTEVRVNLNDGRDGVIFISECDTNLRKCLTDYYVRKSVIRDEKRLGYLIGKYEDVL